MGRVARTPGVVVALLALAAGTACSGPGAGPSAPAESPRTSPSGAPSSAGRPTPQPTATAPEVSPAPRPPLVRVEDVDPDVAVRTVRHLAGTVGPRHGTSPAYRRAADWVARRLEAAGLVVRRQSFPVPGGVSWGVPVAAGRSVNVVAAPAELDPTEPHLVVGAHLDTVPQAPGAEDNASGVGALLAVADALEGTRTRLPTVLVAFGAEEPRGPGDDDHHYGSRAYVARMTPAQRDALRGMVSLDRVGVGTRMPVCSAGEPGALRAEVLAAARRAAAAPLPCAGNRSSDHWSFVRDGLPGVRLGSTPYAGYHSPQDVPSVVRREQLARAARTTVAWLRGS